MHAADETGKKKRKRSRSRKKRLPAEAGEGTAKETTPETTTVKKLPAPKNEHSIANIEKSSDGVELKLR
jgi:hypothetical protein